RIPPCIRSSIRCYAVQTFHPSREVHNHEKVSVGRADHRLDLCRSRCSGASQTVEVSAPPQHDEVSCGAQRPDAPAPHLNARAAQGPNEEVLGRASRPTTPASSAPEGAAEEALIRGGSAKTPPSPAGRGGRFLALSCCGQTARRPV